MKIGVIGAGVMGRGVAQVFAEGGYDVVLLDIKKQALEEAENDIRNTLRFRSLFEKVIPLRIVILYWGVSNLRMIIIPYHL